VDKNTWYSIVPKECCLQIGNSAFFAPIKELSIKETIYVFWNLARGCLCKNNAKKLDQQKL
jgi:hypothetical protein